MMPKYRAAKSRQLSPWLTANLDGKDGRFIQVGNSLVLSKVFQSLSANARYLYLCLAMESGGKQTVRFSHGTAKKYGIPSTTFDRAIKELRTRSFITLIEDEERSQFKTNEFRFAADWKLNPDPHFGDREK